MSVSQIWEAYLYPASGQKCSDRDLQDSHRKHAESAVGRRLSVTGRRSGRVSGFHLPFYGITDLVQWLETKCVASN